MEHHAGGPKAHGAARRSTLDARSSLQHVRFRRLGILSKPCTPEVFPAPLGCFYLTDWCVQIIQNFEAVQIVAESGLKLNAKE